MNIFWLLRGGGPFFGKWQVVVDIFWLVVGGSGYILTGGGWQWVVVDIFWLVVGGGGWWWVVFGGGGYILTGGGWWWVVAQFSLTHLFFTYPVCCEEITSDRTSFDFSERAFDNIFRSKLNKEICLQFFMNLLSSSFFS